MVTFQTRAVRWPAAEQQGCGSEPHHFYTPAFVVPLNACLASLSPAKADRSGPGAASATRRITARLEREIKTLFRRTGLQLFGGCVRVNLTVWGVNTSCAG